MGRWPALSEVEQAAVDRMCELAEQRVGAERDGAELEAIATCLESVSVPRRGLVLAVCLATYLGGEDEWAALPFLVMCGPEEIQLAEEIAGLPAMADAG